MPFGEPRLSKNADVAAASLRYDVVRRQTPMEIRHYKFDRITIDPAKCFGKACIRGLRMPVASILSYLSSGMTPERILKEWPGLEQEDIYQALGYAAWAMKERVVPQPEVTP
jgi:uncharacterized protein (DUF433 family)